MEAVLGAVIRVEQRVKDSVLGVRGVLDVIIHVKTVVTLTVHQRVLQIVKDSVMVAVQDR